MKTILLPRKNNIQSEASFTTIRMVSRIVFVMIGSMLMILAQAQADKRLVMAEKYFAAGEYYTAAGLYGQFLNPTVKSKTPTNFPLNTKRYSEGSLGSYGNKTDILFKQAESYRLANYWTDASALYKECFEKDAAKYASAMYWYAVAQRSLGNYNEAEETINRFLTEYGTGHPLQQAAEKEKQILSFIKGQLGRPDSSMFHLQKIKTSFTTQKGVYAPLATMPNQFMITSTQTDSVAAGQTPYHNRLFNATYKNNSLESIELVQFESIDPSFNQGAASISANGNYLYFTQWKKDTGNVAAIYYSAKTANGWSKPMLLNSVNETGHNSKQPHCSPDGKYLYFSSDRTGGQGGFDIWYAPINADGTTGEAMNAGSMLNSSSNEQAPFYHNAAGTLVFASDRTPGMGGFDLFSSRGSATDWKKAENMGHPVNSSRDDVYFYSSGDGALLDNAFFSSDRGSECCLETYTISKTAKKKMITGVIYNCLDNAPLADAVVVLKDKDGNTKQLKTTSDGRYTFEWNSDGQHEIFVSKDKYVEKSTEITIDGKNESNWQTDTMFNTTMCIKKLVIKVENVVTVYFDFDKSLIKERGLAQLDSIYNILMNDTTFTIQISGYTDGRGTAEYNSVLSDKRAKACAGYLIEKGLDPNRISFFSFGACCPVEMELINGRDNAKGRSMNRRALINISKE